MPAPSPTHILPPLNWEPHQADTPRRCLRGSTMFVPFPKNGRTDGFTKKPKFVYLQERCHTFRPPPAALLFRSFQLDKQIKILPKNPFYPNLATERRRRLIYSLTTVKISQNTTILEYQRNSFTTRRILLWMQRTF